MSISDQIFAQPNVRYNDANLQAEITQINNRNDASSETPDFVNIDAGGGSTGVLNLELELNGDQVIGSLSGSGTFNLAGGSARALRSDIQLPANFRPTKDVHILMQTDDAANGENIGYMVIYGSNPEVWPNPADTALPGQIDIFYDSDYNINPLIGGIPVWNAGDCEFSATGFAYTIN